MRRPTTYHAFGQRRLEVLQLRLHAIDHSHGVLALTHHDVPEAIHERGRILDGGDPATEKHDERATYGDTVGGLYELYKKATEKKRS